MKFLHTKTGVAVLSVASNSCLVLLKLTIGLFIGSVSVLSEAIHSGMDLLASMIALFAVRTSSKPADEGHPFGHGKIENVSGAVEALLIFVAAGWIIYEAVNKLLHPSHIESVGWGVLIMAFSAGVNILVSRQLFKVGQETDSIALKADAWHLRTDVYTSAGVMTGLLLIWIGSHWLPQEDLRWIDPLAAISVAMLIIKAAYDLTRQAGRDLLDGRLLADEEVWIHDYLCEQRPTVRGYHKLRTRKSGAVRFVEFHLFLDSTTTVAESHAFSDQVEKAIEQRFPGSSVTVHVEPCDGECRDECLDDCLLTASERLAIRMN
jgi:cation diffusion facilitator family transporter